MTIKLESPAEYSLNNPVHFGVYAYNGVGKTTFAGISDLRTVILDCGDSGAITLRHQDPKRLKVIRISSCVNYIDTVGELINMADKFDLLVVDTLSGLQSKAVREVKGGKKNFEMNQRKWGQAGSRLIECINETNNFPKDVLYLMQERKKKEGEDSPDVTTPALMPSVKSVMSGMIDWIGYLYVEDEKRKMTFVYSDSLEAKDRAGTFPKVIVNPTYMAVRKRILATLQGDSNGR